MTAAARKHFELRGVHVLIAMIMFFGVTIGVNIAFATLAIRSFPGEDAQRPYQQGLHYNQTIKAREAQAKLGWRIAPALTEVDHGAVLTLTAIDAANQPLADLDVQGTLRRPIADKFDIPLHFKAKGNGVYEVNLPELAPGLWEFRGQASTGQKSYAIEERLIWRPSTQP